MRNLFLLILFLLLALIGVDVDATPKQPVLITNVHVIPMDGERVLRDRSVLIEAGRIIAIRTANETEAPEEARRIDGGGGYLMPGLAEMHAHVPGEGTPMSVREDILYLYLANGVTLVRGMLGEPWHLELREALDKGEIMGPRLITSGPSLNGNSVDNPEHGARMVREQARAGYDFLKIHPGLNRAEFDAIAAAAHEADMPFSGHVPADVGIDRALEAGYASIDHLDRYPRALVSSGTLDEVEPGFFDYRLAPHARAEKITAIAEKTREAGVWNVPTETLMHNVLIEDPETIRDERPEFAYLPGDMIDAWIERVRRSQSAEDYDREAAESFIRLRMDLIKALQDAGAGLLLGSDAPQIFNVPGFSIHHEIAIMEAAGLTPYQILQSGTVNPARFFGQADDWGQVREGMRAELLLLNGNPLDDLDNLRKVRGVFVNGRWHEQASIDAVLSSIRKRYAE